MYGDRVFLTKEELRKYIRSQEKWKCKNSKKKRSWIVIELEDIKKYGRPIKPKGFVPVGGQYIKG